MPYLQTDSSEHTELREIIRQTRVRWRAKLLARGAAVVCVGSVLTFLLAAYLLESFKFSPAAVLGLRVAVAAAFVALTVWFVVKPLLRRVSDEQVALYLEEHHPALEASLVSAVDASGGAESDQRSRVLVRKIVADAIEHCQRVDAARAADRSPLRTYSGVSLGALAVAALVLLVGPAYFRDAASALLRLSQGLEAASPYRIDVEPGTTRVSRGTDQTVTARLSGFTAGEASLVSRSGQEETYTRLPMVASPDGTFEAMLFDVAGDVEYYIEAAGVRSSRFHLTALDLPDVKRLSFEFVYPAHTGLAPERIEDGGDIAVLAGTEVRLKAETTLPANGGRVWLDDKTEVALARQADATLTGSFVVKADGFYRIELDGPTGDTFAGSPQYTIDALLDREPSITFTKPRRDLNATPLEEVFVEAQAEDDFGVRDMQLVYSVNGGPEKTVRLFGGAREAAKDVTAGHTFYLEELGLKAGDVVSYFGRVRDNDPADASKSASSDMFFVRIRPFNQDFKAAQSMAGAGGAGGGGMQANELSERQRQIVTGTFNVTRDRKAMTADKVRESSVVLGLSQSRLREQVAELSERMDDRLLGDQPRFQEVAESLNQAIEEMKDAEAKLQARNPEAALAPEQRALSLIQKAEQQYEIQVAMGQNGGGGGGGGAAGSGMSEDLASLFEMELDKLANQYETVGGANAQQNGANQLDELAEKLRDLARRQEQEAERERRRAASGSPQGGGAAGQRALADQTEEAARQLERLAREQSNPELSDAARRLQQAADDMRRAAANGGRSGGQASSALERMRDVQERLARDRQNQAQGDLAEAAQEASDLARDQRDIASGVNNLRNGGSSAPQQDAARFAQRKDDLARRVGALERRLDQTAAQLNREDKATAQKLREAAGDLRNERVRDKISYSKDVMRRGTQEQVQAFESEISSNLEDLRQQLQDAQASAGRASGRDPKEEALERAQRLARGLESMDRRLREQAQDGREGRGQGQSDSQGDGGQGQQGQDGQSGQSGQGGQADGRGQGSGRANLGGMPGPGGFGGRFLAGGLSPSDQRQFRGEFRQWAAEAQELARRLREQGVDPSELNDVLRGLRALDSDRVFNNAGEFERLQSAVLEGVKQF
ncbi:MAG: hypothetical protein AB7I50_18980, partial [Vicinamibacterales bacterium]